jgi:hypothetical protein
MKTFNPYFLSKNFGWKQYRLIENTTVNCVIRGGETPPPYYPPSVGKQSFL